MIDGASDGGLDNDAEGTFDSSNVIDGPDWKPGIDDGPFDTKGEIVGTAELRIEEGRLLPIVGEAEGDKVDTVPSTQNDLISSLRNSPPSKIVIPSNIPR
jgi:hypothetical protein